MRPDAILIYVAFAFMKVVSLALKKLILICTGVQRPTQRRVRRLRGEEWEGAQCQTRITLQASEPELKAM